MKRYGPGWLPWLGTLFALCWTVAWLVLRHEAPDAWQLLFVAAFFLVGTLPGWSWYGLDRDGIHRWGVTGHRLVPWEDVATIVGRRVSRQDHADSVLFQRVVDERGRTLLQLGPWIARRRELTRRIREILVHRRHAAEGRDA